MKEIIKRLMLAMTVEITCLTSMGCTKEIINMEKHSLSGESEQGKLKSGAERRSSGRKLGKETQVVGTIGDEPQFAFPERGFARLPFRKVINHVVIDGLDARGGIHPFFIDTGASFSAVTPRFLELVEAPILAGPNSGEAYGAQGAVPGSLQLRELQNLRLADLIIERAGAVEIDLSSLDEKFGIQIHGILGYNVLSHVITLIDYPAGEVVFFDPARRGALDSLGKPEHVIPFRLLMGALIEVQGSVNGKQEMPFIVDVGSRFTVLNQPASRRSGIVFEPVAEGKPVALGCGAGTGMPVYRGEATSLRFGTLAYEKPELQSIDLPVLTTLGLAEKEAGLLGNDLLGHYRVAIDYERLELRFWKA